MGKISISKANSQKPESNLATIQGGVTDNLAKITGKVNDHVLKDLKHYEHLLITDTTNIPAPDVVVRIAGQSISTRENVTTFSGPPKAGKSAIVSIIIAGAIAPGEYDGCPEIEIQKADGRAVIHIDTESARHRHQRNVRSILKRVELDSWPENLLSYNFRSLLPHECKEATISIATSAKQKFGAVHLIVIDGAADYVSDVNDPEASNELVKFLEDLAVTFNCPVIQIIHVNPNSQKERGHLGSQLQRKSESVVSVIESGDITSLEGKFLRDGAKGGISEIHFKYDASKGYHIYCGEVVRDDNAEKKRKEMIIICDKVFGNLNALEYGDALNAIIRHTGLGKYTARDHFASMNAFELIAQGEDKKWRKVIK